MADQYKTLIEFINACPQYMKFTSRDLKEFTSEAATPTAVNSFISSAFRMEVLSRQPILNPGHGPRFKYNINRSFTKLEAKKMTTRPDCINFKKEIDAKYKKRKAAIEKRVVLKPQAKKKKEAIKAIASAGKKVSVTDNVKKTVITIYK